MTHYKNQILLNWPYKISQKVDILKVEKNCNKKSRIQETPYLSTNVDRVTKVFGSDFFDQNYFWQTKYCNKKNREKKFIAAVGNVVSVVAAVFGAVGAVRRLDQ